MVFMKMNAVNLYVSIVVFWLFMYWCSVGMGSGSAGKEGGPFKALLRQQTQSALEQRVRVTRDSLFLYCQCDFIVMLPVVLFHTSFGYVPVIL